MTHDELAHSLALHLKNERRMVWEDIPAGKSGSVRPDVYTIEKSFANPNPVSYEVKISVSDFRSDITKGKWSKYLDFSYGVVFAVPKGLVTKKDIPAGCGLMTFNGEFWNTVKRPTMNPSVLDTELLLKLLIVGEERQTAKEIIQPRELDEWKAKGKISKKFGQDFASKLSLIKDYPSIKKEVHGWYKDIYTAVGKLEDYDPDSRLSGWLLNRLVEDRIKECDKDAYVNSLKEDLDKLKDQISITIDRYKGNL